MKLLLIGWLKLNENDVAPAATDTGVRPGVLLTPPPAVLTHVTPQGTSKLFAGLVVAAPTIRITTLILLDNGLATVAVQLWAFELLERLRWFVQLSLPPTRLGPATTFTVTLTECTRVPFTITVRV